MDFSKKLEKKTGIVVLLIIVLLVFVLFVPWTTLFHSNKTYYILVDNVHGLQNGDPVFVESYRAGIVKEVRFVSETNAAILIKIIIANNVFIPVRSNVEVIIQDNAGLNKVLKICPRGSLDYLDDGDTLFVTGYSEIIHSDSGLTIKEGNKTPQSYVTAENDIIYKVQLLTSGKKLDQSDKAFKGLGNISFYKQNDVYKYTFGEYQERNKAEEIRDSLKLVGFPDAFLVSFRNSKRID